MKKIFEYQLIFKTKEKITTKQEDGSELSKLEDVDKTVKVIIKEPSRKEMEAARNIYQETWSDAVRRGILTRAIIDKTYSNSQGFLSEPEKKELENSARVIKEVQEKFAVIKDIKEEDYTEEQKLEVGELSEQFSGAQKEFDKLEQKLEILYNNSAETIAFDKQILFNTLFLSYIEIDGKVQPIVAGDTIETRLTNFDSILENQTTDETKSKSVLYDEILRRNGQYLQLLSTGKIDIKQLERLNEKLDSGEISL